MTGEERVEFVRAATEMAKAEGPRVLLRRYDELFTEDFRWTSAMAASFGGDTYVGRSGFERFWDDFETSFAGFDYSIESFRAVGDDTVLVLLRIRVQGTESGVPIEQDIGWVFHFDGDRIAAAESHTTWAAAEAAVAGRSHA
jgi:ketosteroid isomerase-like protein